MWESQANTSLWECWALPPLGPMARGDRQLPIHGLRGGTEGLGGPGLRVHAPKSRLSDLGTGYTWWDKRANPYLRVVPLALWEESGFDLG